MVSFNSARDNKANYFDNRYQNLIALGLSLSFTNYSRRLLVYGIGAVPYLSTTLISAPFPSPLPMNNFLSWKI
jgi:hypothetical protein